MRLTGLDAVARGVVTAMTMATASGAAVLAIGGGEASAEQYVAFGINQADAQIGPVQIDPSQGYSLAYGITSGDLRAELSYDRVNGEAAGGIIQANGNVFGATLFYDGIHLGPVKISPGVGVDHVNGEGTVVGNEIASVSQSDWHLAVQGTIPLSDRLSVSVGYTALQDTKINVVGFKLRRSW